MWQEGVHRCIIHVPPQVHPNHAPTTSGGLTPHPLNNNAHPSEVQGYRPGTCACKPKIPYALESYLGQSVKEEPWNNVFGFNPRGGERTGGNSE